MKQRKTMWIGLGSLGLALFAIPGAANLALQNDSQLVEEPLVEGAPAPKSHRRSTWVRPREGHDLSVLMNQAELVFQGEVVHIQAVKSAAGEAGRTPIPFSFVTFRVDNVVKGMADPFLTLRFMGGLDEETGRVLHVSHVPEFQVGDRDILFVQNEVTMLSPMIQALGGRLRVRENHVCFDYGAPAMLDAKGRLMRTLSGDLAEAAPLEDVLEALASIPSEPATVPFPSANAAVAFYGPDFTPAGPPSDDAAPATLSDEERAERASQPAPVRPTHRVVNRR